ncbi:MAG: hypothetical protein WAT39_24305 [Planctomycetota bacterium]
MAKSHTGATPTKAVTVRVSALQLKRLMRLRGAATQSELIQSLLSEAEEREAALAVLRETAGTAKPGDFDDRLL